MKLIISGSRTFTDYELLCDRAGRVHANVEEITEMIFGGQLGAEALGKQWAEENGVPIKIMLANRSRDGADAIKVRNEAMGEYADALLAFWDGDSVGTKSLIRTMKILEKPYHVAPFGDMI